jgi:hypothetical protein
MTAHWIGYDLKALRFLIDESRIALILVISKSFVDSSPPVRLEPKDHFQSRFNVFFRGSAGLSRLRHDQGQASSA